MIGYLLRRPVGVGVTTLALVALGLLALRTLPVALLPDVPVPEITVQASYPNAQARELQRSIEGPLRNQLLQVRHLQHLESVTQDGLTAINLRFAYGTDVRLAYLETNEKIDGILGILPRDLERPKVIRAGAGDLPVFNLNVLPAPGTDFLELSEFCENVLRRRIEQLPEVALVDATGLAQPEVVIEADPDRLRALGVTGQRLGQLLREQNLNPGNLSQREGHYQYNVRFSSVLRTTSDLENVSLRIGEARRLVPLREVARVRLTERLPRGVYTFNGERAVCLAIVRQGEAQLPRLRREVGTLLAQFRHDYPQLRFELSQDQTELLDVSIQNLVGSLLTGALLAVGVVFLFLRNWRLPLLVGLVMPVSLALTFLGFYLLGLSINIVSLAGLVLGVGEVIDSAIILLEAIEEKREAGLPLAEACVLGTGEVIRPLTTSVLTNSAVFLPLLLLSGLAGALFFDQAVSVTLALGLSLLTSYVLVPVAYFLLFRRVPGPYRPASATRVGRAVESAYLAAFRLTFRRKRLVVTAFAGLLLGAVFLAYRLPKQAMPAIGRTELEVSIHWNEPLGLAASGRNVRALLDGQPGILAVSGYLGQQQFLLNRDLQLAESEVRLSVKVASETGYRGLREALLQRAKASFPAAAVEVRPGRNVFEQLFNTSQPPLRLKLYNPGGPEVVELETADQIADLLAQAGVPVDRARRQEAIGLHLRHDRLLAYDVDQEALVLALKTALRQAPVTELQGRQRFVPVVLSGMSDSLGAGWQNGVVLNRGGEAVPVRALVEAVPRQDYSVLYADREGAFVPFGLFPDATRDVEALRREVTGLLVGQPGVLLGWGGSYETDRAELSRLGLILLLAVGLLFCILTAQFESLQQPFIVLLILLLGLAGAVWALAGAGSSLNVLSAIGMVVLVGLLDNDSILKIDTINRSLSTLGLEESLRQAGLRRLNSQVMTFLTTALGLSPVLFSGGLGAELQRPLVLAVVGGMVIGLLVSWSLLPLLYSMLHKRHTRAG
jgi:multidrug efflux pump subunit AcrB